MECRYIGDDMASTRHKYVLKDSDVKALKEYLLVEFDAEVHELLEAHLQAVPGDEVQKARIEAAERRRDEADVMEEYVDEILASYAEEDIESDIQDIMKVHEESVREYFFDSGIGTRWKPKAQLDDREAIPDPDWSDAESAVDWSDAESAVEGTGAGIDTGHKEDMQTFREVETGQQDEAEYGVLALLAMVQSDFANLEASTKASEAQSLKAYEDFMTDLRKERKPQTNVIDKASSDRQRQEDISDQGDSG